VIPGRGGLQSDDYLLGGTEFSFAKNELLTIQLLSWGSRPLGDNNRKRGTAGATSELGVGNSQRVANAPVRTMNQAGGRGLHPGGYAVLVSPKVGTGPVNSTAIDQLLNVFA